MLQIVNLAHSYRADDGGVYYFRQVGSEVYGFGEEKNGAFALVFRGRRSAGLVSGQWFHVPKGDAQSSGELSFLVSEGGTVLSKISATGDLAATSWLSCSVVPRIFPDPNDHDGDEPNVDPPSVPSPCDALRADSAPRKARFQATGPEDLTGTWRGDDDLFYYVRQAGSDLVWVGESASRTNVFFGSRDELSIDGFSLDLPKGTGNAFGPLTLSLRDDAVFGSGVIDKVEGTGPARLSRFETLEVDLRLTQLRVVAREERRGGGDEPFLWSAFVKLDGDTVDLSTITSETFGDLFTALDNSSSVVVSTSGSHHNITSRNNVAAGEQLPIPDRVGRFQTQLRTIRGLDPNVPLQLPGKNQPTAKELTTLGLVVVAWEQDGLKDASIEAGRTALVDTLREEIDQALATANFTDFSALEEPIAEAVEAAIRDAEGFVLNPDDLLGFAFQKFSYEELAASNGQIPLSFRFTGSADHPADYRVAGTLKVS